MDPEHARNRLYVARDHFTDATKVFAKKGIATGAVLMAFENGFLSFESGAVTVAMRAVGDWQGRAVFSPQILRALATVPPDVDPIPITYAEGQILIGSMTIPCKWTWPRQELAHKLENPGLVDMLALGRTLSRAEIRGTEQGKRIRSAVVKAERRIKNATAQLIDLEISEQEIRDLVDARIASRIRTTP